MPDTRYDVLSRFLSKMQLAGSANVAADCLPRAPIPIDKVSELQISEGEESLLLVVWQEQRQDQELAQLIVYLKNRSLPDDVKVTRHIIGQGFYFH